MRVNIHNGNRVQGRPAAAFCVAAGIIGILLGVAPRAQGEVILSSAVLIEEIKPGGPGTEVVQPLTVTGSLPQAGELEAFISLESRSFGRYSLTDTLFDFTSLHIVQQGSGRSEGTVDFSVTGATDYALSGFHNPFTNSNLLVSSVTLINTLDNSLLFLNVDVREDPVDFFVSVAPDQGSATGVLEAGVTYRLKYAFQSFGDGSVASLKLALTPQPDEVTPVPLPGAVWGGGALLALVGGRRAWRHRRLVAADASPEAGY